MFYEKNNNNIKDEKYSKFESNFNKNWLNKNYKFEQKIEYFKNELSKYNYIKDDYFKELEKFNFDNFGNFIEINKNKEELIYNISNLPFDKIKIMYNIKKLQNELELVYKRRNISQKYYFLEYNINNNIKIPDEIYDKYSNEIDKLDKEILFLEKQIDNLNKGFNLIKLYKQLDRYLKENKTDEVDKLIIKLQKKIENINNEIEKIYDPEILNNKIKNISPNNQISLFIDDFINDMVLKDPKFYKNDLFLDIEDNISIKNTIINKIKTLSDTIEIKYEKIKFWKQINNLYPEIFNDNELYEKLGDDFLNNSDDGILNVLSILSYENKINDEKKNKLIKEQEYYKKNLEKEKKERANRIFFLKKKKKQYEQNLLFLEKEKIQEERDKIQKFYKQYDKFFDKLEPKSILLVKQPDNYIITKIQKDPSQISRSIFLNIYKYSNDIINSITKLSKLILDKNLNWKIFQNTDIHKEYIDKNTNPLLKVNFLWNNDNIKNNDEKETEENNFIINKLLYNLINKYLKKNKLYINENSKKLIDISNNLNEYKNFILNKFYEIYKIFSNNNNIIEEHQNFNLIYHKQNYDYLIKENKKFLDFAINNQEIIIKLLNKMKTFICTYMNNIINYIHEVSDIKETDIVENDSLNNRLVFLNNDFLNNNLEFLSKDLEYLKTTKNEIDIELLNIINLEELFPNFIKADYNNIINIESSSNIQIAGALEMSHDEHYEQILFKEEQYKLYQELLNEFINIFSNHIEKICSSIDKKELFKNYDIITYIDFFTKLRENKINGIQFGVNYICIENFINYLNDKFNFETIQILINKNNKEDLNTYFQFINIKDFDKDKDSLIYNLNKISTFLENSEKLSKIYDLINNIKYIIFYINNNYYHPFKKLRQAIFNNNFDLFKDLLYESIIIDKNSNDPDLDKKIKISNFYKYDIFTITQRFVQQFDELDDLTQMISFALFNKYKKDTYTFNDISNMIKYLNEISNFYPELFNKGGQILFNKIVKIFPLIFSINESEYIEEFISNINLIFPELSNYDLSLICYEMDKMFIKKNSITQEDLNILVNFANNLPFVLNDFCYNKFKNLISLIISISKTNERNLLISYNNKSSIILQLINIFPTLADNDDFKHIILNIIINYMKKFIKYKFNNTEERFKENTNFINIMDELYPFFFIKEKSSIFNFYKEKYIISEKIIQELKFTIKSINIFDNYYLFIYLLYKLFEYEPKILEDNIFFKELQLDKKIFIILNILYKSRSKISNFLYNKFIITFVNNIDISYFQQKSNFFEKIWYNFYNNENYNENNNENYNENNNENYNENNNQMKGGYSINKNNLINLYKNIDFNRKIYNFTKLWLKNEYKEDSNIKENSYLEYIYNKIIQDEKEKFYEKKCEDKIYIENEKQFNKCIIHKFKWKLVPKNNEEKNLIKINKNKYFKFSENVMNELPLLNNITTINLSNKLYNIENNFIEFINLDNKKFIRKIRNVFKEISLINKIIKFKNKYKINKKELFELDLEYNIFYNDILLSENNFLYELKKELIKIKNNEDKYMENIIITDAEKIIINNENFTLKLEDKLDSSDNKNLDKLYQELYNKYIKLKTKLDDNRDIFNTEIMKIN